MWYHSLIQTVFWTLVVCFLSFYPYVLVILGVKGGLRQATLSQKNIKVGLGYILSLSVPRRWTSRKQLPKENTQNITSKSPWNKRLLTGLFKSPGSSILCTLEKAFAKFMNRWKNGWHATLKGRVCMCSCTPASFSNLENTAVNNGLTCQSLSCVRLYVTKVHNPKCQIATKKVHLDLAVSLVELFQWHLRGLFKHINLLC